MFALTSQHGAQVAAYFAALTSVTGRSSRVSSSGSVMPHRVVTTAAAVSCVRGFDSVPFT